MTRDENKRLWNDPNNWNSDGSYSCAADGRLLVGNRAGWTLNMAHRQAKALMFGVVLLARGAT
jgi:uncharacterized membrane protein